MRASLHRRSPYASKGLPYRDIPSPGLVPDHVRRYPPRSSIHTPVESRKRHAANSGSEADNIPSMALTSCSGKPYSASVSTGSASSRARNARSTMARARACSQSSRDIAPFQPPGACDSAPRTGIFAQHACPNASGNGRSSSSHLSYHRCQHVGACGGQHHQQRTSSTYQRRDGFLAVACMPGFLGRTDIGLDLNCGGYLTHARAPLQRHPATGRYRSASFSGSVCLWSRVTGRQSTQSTVATALTLERARYAPEGV